MKKLICSEFKSGRHFTGPLPHNMDLITSIENFCIENSIHMAAFSLIGAVSSFTIGYYDQSQEVYVTFKEKTPLEIVNCTGNVSCKDGKPFIHAHILLGDKEGKTKGGHLFSETIIFAGEIDLQELIGKPLNRVHDSATGLKLWK